MLKIFIFWTFKLRQTLINVSMVPQVEKKVENHCVRETEWERDDDETLWGKCSAFWEREKKVSLMKMCEQLSSMNTKD